MADKERDFETNPYSKDEQRVADYLWERGVGGGDDPIGFILASHAFTAQIAARYRWLKEQFYGATFANLYDSPTVGGGVTSEQFDADVDAEIESAKAH